MTFTHQQPFTTSTGEVVTMKSLQTVHGKQDVQVYENSNNYRPEDLKPMTAAEYEQHLIDAEYEY